MSHDYMLCVAGAEEDIGRAFWSTNGRGMMVAYLMPELQQQRIHPRSDICQQTGPQQEVALSSTSHARYALVQQGGSVPPSFRSVAGV